MTGVRWQIIDEREREVGEIESGRIGSAEVDGDAVLLLR